MLLRKPNKLLLSLSDGVIGGLGTISNGHNGYKADHSTEIGGMRDLRGSP